MDESSGIPGGSGEFGAFRESRINRFRTESQPPLSIETGCETGILPAMEFRSLMMTEKMKVIPIAVSAVIFLDGEHL